MAEMESLIDLSPDQWQIDLCGSPNRNRDIQLLHLCYLLLEFQYTNYYGNQHAIKDDGPYVSAVPQGCDQRDRSKRPITAERGRSQQ